MADEVKVVRIIIDSSKAIDGSSAATRALANIDKATNDSANAMARMEQSLNRVGGYLKAQLALLLADVAARMISLAKSTLDTVANFGELADQMGITVQGLQALEFSAVQNNVKFEQLQTGIAKFSQRIGEAAGGSKEAIEAFSSIGVKLLDIQGKLVPTEALLQRTAQAILAIDDPAKRISAAVDVFGKAGAKMIPMLADLAGGMDALAAKAKAAGVIISDDAIRALDILADRSGVAALKARALFAELSAPIATAALQAVNSLIASILNGLGKLREFLGEQSLKDDRRELGTWNETVKKQEAIVAQRQAALDALPGSAGWAERWAALQKEQTKLTDYRASRAQWAARVAQGEAAPSQYATQLMVSGSFPTEPPAGVGDPTAKGGGGGESPEDKYRKLTEQLRIAAEAQNAMTAAARGGEVAFEEHKATLDATQKVYDIFKTTLDATDPRLTTVRDRLLEIARGKVAESFNVATTALEKQNVLLEAEIALRDELPEIRAKELAIIKATQEAEKAGSALKKEDVEARRQAIEQNETLKAQQEELKKSQELWTEPLKQALRDIQSIGADAFDKLLENGKFSFEELGQTFMRIIRRMAAEFLALATIRPVMSVLVNAVSPSMAQQMGLGTTGLGGIGGGGGGLSGGGLGGLFGGGFSSALGDFGSWLNTPFTGPYAGLSPASMQGVPMLSGSAGAGLTPLGLLGGIGSIGMGAYGIASGNPIGGAAGILGGGLSLLSSAGLIGSAFGPIGMGIGLIGGLLGGLLGGGLGGTPPTITDQTYAQLTYGGGGWYTTGGAWGPSANSSGSEAGLRGLTGGIDSVFGLLGGVKDASKVWGLSAQNRTVSGKGWSSSSDSLYLVNPNGGQELWRMNEAGMMDTGSSQLARRSILEGAVGEISANMRKVVQSVGETTAATLQELATAITEVKAFDDAISGLNKTMTTAEQAVAQIDASFAAMYATAAKYGLATGDIDTAKQAARLGYATDFGKALSRDILAITDPKAAALQDIEDWRTLMVDNNRWLLDNVAGAMDQIVKIEQLAGLKRAAIIEQTTNSALASLKSSLDRLLYGDLSGAAPGDVLSGTKATYMADLAQAFTGDAAAAGRLNASTADYMQAAASYYGTSSTAYQALRRQTIIDVASAYRYAGGQFGDIPAGYDVILGNSLGGLAPASANANYPSLTSTNGWLGSAWSNATNAWLAANPPSSDVTTGLATLSQQMMEVINAMQSGEDRQAELTQLFADSIAIWQRIAAKIAA